MVRKNDLRTLFHPPPLLRILFLLLQKAKLILHFCFLQMHFCFLQVHFCFLQVHFPAGNPANAVCDPEEGSTHP